MTPLKPSKTVADYLVIAASPALIMLLVGSLCFFLIEVFFRGEAVGSVRWVMFWFVMAVVLVARIGIEQGVGHAAIYGLGLAAATWLYLVRLYPAFILGMILLAIVWWCAHKLTWDCTLIEDDEDASGSGLLQTVGHWQKFPWKKSSPPEPKTPVPAAAPPPPPIRASNAAPDPALLFALDIKAKSARASQSKRKAAPPHPPGQWVVYFSLAALPLFGLGQVLLPADDAAARHAGFTYLFVYVAAAMGLLLTTSFLGLRRYLRQRYLPMPGAIAFGWVRFGVTIGAVVLAAALLLPRPGGNDAWQSLRYQVDYRIHQASHYALRFGPHGNGPGRTGNQNSAANPLPQNPSASSTQSQPQPGNGQSPSPDQSGPVQPQNASTPQPAAEGAAGLYQLFKILFIIILVLLAAWWLFRRRDLILSALQSIIAALRQFFRDLFGFRLRFATAAATGHPAPAPPPRRPFADFHNPFLTGRETAWTRGQLILYSYEALRAWAAEKGVVPRPDQTAREFCRELADRYPEILSELTRLSALYAQAAYTPAGAESADLTPVKTLWQFFYA